MPTCQSCASRGEASTLRGVDGDLSTIRAKELEAAALELGVADVHLRDFPDGGLQDIVLPTLLGQAVAIAKTEAARRNPGLRLFRRHRSSGSHSSDRGRISIGDRMGTRYSRMDSTEKCHEVAE